MKIFMYPFLLLALLVGGENINMMDDETSLQGTWELRNFYYYDNNEVTDTLPTTKGYRQVKVFTSDKVMWSRSVPMDSVEWFGYGSYNVVNDMLIETLEYGSASMMEIIDTMRVFTFELQLDKNKYSQITLDADGKRFSSENYVRVE